MTENPYEDSLAPIEGYDPAAQTRGCAGWIVGAAVIVLVAALFLPALRRGGAEPARRTQCKNNLKQIALGLHNYHAVHGHFPPAYTVDDKGNRLHSWRTLLLPYLGQSALYETIDLKKPWNHPVNQAASETAVQEYRCPSTDLEPNATTYHAVIGPNATFPDDGTTRRFRDISDELSNTLLVVEVSPDLAINWMDPYGDTGIEFLMSLSKTTDTAHIDGVQAALGDGSVRFFHNTIRRDVLKAMITANAGDVIPTDFQD